MLYVFEHYKYEDLCGDDYYGKTSKIEQQFIIDLNNDEASKLLDRLNEKNHSFYARDPEDDWDRDFLDEDYWRYYPYELKVSTMEEIIKKYRL